MKALKSISLIFAVFAVILMIVFKTAYSMLFPVGLGLYVLLIRADIADISASIGLWTGTFMVLISVTIYDLYDYGVLAYPGLKWISSICISAGFLYVFFYIIIKLWKAKKAGTRC